MDLLQIKGNQIVNAKGMPVRLRGACVGGWMNLEDFINGYPGTEQALRRKMMQVLGVAKAQFFFDRWHDYFFAEEDVAFLSSLGANVVRLPLNYRHFENDAEPFKYIEKGFARLDQALGWCAQHGVYVILELHSAQGFQGPGWHCDNSSRHTFFWDHPHFQDRFVALWEEFARRYKGNAAVAGYDVLNEPNTDTPYGRFRKAYTPNWDALNGIYRRVVNSIRMLDPDHLIILEGDNSARLFDGLDAPFADNLVYSSHNYTKPGFGPGKYPGTCNGEYWDRADQQNAFLNHQGTHFTQRYNVPLLVGEFGSVYNGPTEEIPDRLRALDDQIAVLEEFQISWTTWTYKDIYVMGLVQPDPDSEYVQTIRPILDAKHELATDHWIQWLPPTPAVTKINEVARYAESIINDPSIEPEANNKFLGQVALCNYFGYLLQSNYARCFEEMSETDIDRVMRSWALENCRPHQGLMDVLKKHTRGPDASAARAYAAVNH